MLLWRPRLGIHIEVKVGDEQFGKTFETGEKLRAKHAAHEWKDVVLIPNESLEAWNESARSEGPEDQETLVVLWEDVARALRSCLWSKRESAIWRIWAWTFCGAIERRLLGLERQHKTRTDSGQFNTLIRWLDLLDLEKGTKNENKE